MQIEIDRDRFVATMTEQAEIGGIDGGGLHRLALSDADRRVRDWFSRADDGCGIVGARGRVREHVRSARGT